MPSDFILEICLDSAESALVAQEAGADRVELCSGLVEGGTTPSIGMIKTARQLITIPLHVIIRPRGGEFSYCETKFEVMKTDILAAKEAKADGVVLGILNSDGTVDIKRTRELVELARPMSVTFHRAFDFTPDPLQALEDVISTGSDRILTSGQKPTAVEGIELIKKLIEKAGDRIIIMPGAGLNEHNLAEFIRTTGAKEVHMTANIVFQSSTRNNNPELKLSGKLPSSDFELSRTDFDKVKRIREIKLT